MTKLTITGIQEAQAANLRIMAAVKPENGLGRAVNYAATEVHRYAVSIMHVDTGAMRASARVSMRGNSQAEIYLDPSATNPRSKRRTAEYGLAEHARGGGHAFFERAYTERGAEASERALKYLQGQF